MSERKAELTKKLSDSRAYLNAVLDQVGDRWESPVYADGLQWTVRQVLVHLADAERGHYNQVTNIAEGNEIIPPDFDIQRYNKRMTEKNLEKTADQAREDLTTQRLALVQWLEGLDEGKLDRTGRHASLQILSVSDILRLIAAHERDHALDIAGALKIDLKQ